jgi:hypothetical protein
MLTIGCDFHTRYQQIALAREETAELLVERKPAHPFCGFCRKDGAFDFDLVQHSPSRIAHKTKSFPNLGRPPLPSEV